MVNSKQIDRLKARSSRLTGANKAALDARIRSLENRLRKKRRRIRRRKRFFKKIGSGLSKFARGLGCAALTVGTEIIKHPDIMAKAGILSEKVLESEVNPEAIGEAVVIFEQIADRLGVAVVEKCIKNEKQRRAALAMIKVLDFSKYIAMAKERGVIVTIKAMFDETLKKAEMTGEDLMTKVGIDPSVYRKFNSLVQKAEDMGLELPDNFLSLPNDQKLAAVRSAMAKGVRSVI